MGQSIAICSIRKSFAILMLGWGILVAPRFSIAQQPVIENPPPAKPQITQSSTPIQVGVPPSLAVEPEKRDLPSQHAFWDRTNLALFAGVAFTRGMDYASTRNFQARGRQEILLPDDVVNNSAAFASLEAAATMTNVGVAYLLHKTGHHTLERWLSIGHIAATGFGDVRNYCLESRHPE
jgi:hypothetical protein